MGSWLEIICIASAAAIFELYQTDVPKSRPKFGYARNWGVFVHDCIAFYDLFSSSYLPHPPINEEKSTKVAKSKSTTAIDFGEFLAPPLKGRDLLNNSDHEEN